MSVLRVVRNFIFSAVQQINYCSAEFKVDEVGRPYITHVICASILRVFVRKAKYNRPSFASKSKVEVYEIVLLLQHSCNTVMDYIKLT